MTQTVSVSLPSALRDRFLVYGPRATSPNTASNPDEASRSLLDYLASWRVPHSYFTQFYIVSVLSSLFWGVQLFFRGNVFQMIALRVSEEHQAQSMALSQVMVCWLLLALQGSRRLWESYEFKKPSSSQMWVVHWLLGIGFYFAAGIAIWIEGSGMVIGWTRKDEEQLANESVATVMSRSLTLADIQITNAPSLRTFLCVPLFLVASGIQHDCHHFLFSLKKYSLPDHPIFRGIVCPHYGAECIIYLSFALLAAPPGQIVNKTMLACLAFVAVNLGITAQTTKQWYMQKYGHDQVQNRWLMIPYIY